MASTAPRSISSCQIKSSALRAEAIARGLGELGITWSCNAKANVPYETLRVMWHGALLLKGDLGAERVPDEPITAAIFSRLKKITP